jgi:hypothetical protein
MVQSDERGHFDELVVSALWAHLEMLSDDHLFVRFGDVTLTVWRDGDGVHVRHNDGTILGPNEGPKKRKGKR